MDYMGFIRNGYHQQPNYHVQAFNGQHQGHQGYQQYNLSFEQQQLVYAQLQQQRAAAMINSGAISQTKPTESKPRLAKDEVETLEREFQKNPKPNSSLKRELADQMRVDVARINNWFQNRRAKAKQIKRTQEFEAQNSTEQAPSESGSPEDHGEGSVSEFYGMSNHSQPLQASSASFDDNISSDQTSHPLSSQEEDDSSASVMSSLDQGVESVEDEENEAFTQEEYPSPSSLHYQQSDGSGAAFQPVAASFIPTHPTDNFHNMMPYASSEMTDHSHPASLPISSPGTYSATHGHVSGLQGFGQFTQTPCMNDGSMSSFPPQYAAEDIDTSSFKSEGHVMSELGSPDISVKLEHLSPSSVSQTSPVSADLRFKSPPPPADIATRRKLAKPAQLNPSAFRSYSYGPRTGIDMPRRSEAASPMRRIASATGSMPPRIQKLTLGSAPRSPMFTERNKEAFLQSLQGALSPVTPNEATHANHQGVRETTVSSNSSDEESRYTFGASHNPYFQAASVPSSIKTPPGTPGIHSQFPMNNMDAAWNFMPSDEPLVTPGLGSFGSDMDFPAASSAPGYAASQPTTPSFPPSIGPTYYPMFNGNGAASLEYKFPDSYNTESSARSSPLQAHSRHFQFTQNITPQDFSHER